MNSEVDAQDDFAARIRAALTAPLEDPINNAVETARVLFSGEEQDLKSDRVASSAPPELAPEFSEEAIALRFAQRHTSDLRFVEAWGRWLRFDGRCWRFDETRHAFDHVRRLCREVAAESDKPRISVAIASAKTVAAVERLAQADRRLAATVDQWDADPWLLNTPDGVVDLKTGNVRPHKPDDFMTKITAVGPRGDCPRFLKFLSRVTGGDESFVAYLRRVLGYALTGSTREEALFFIHGRGANGKGVLLSTIAGIFGRYHRAAPMESFIASTSDRHPTDLAGLRGARLVTASETEEGRHWAEARIKQLTGGDLVSARFMRQDFFDYQPAFKLVFAGNHRPSLRSVGEATRRRFHLLPFTVTIPHEERDLNLKEALKAEWPGILHWLIEGALEWETDGLRPPVSVIDATDAYLLDEDAIAAWIDERCDRDPTASAPLKELFVSWSAWAVQAGEPVGSSKRFAKALENHSFATGRRNIGRIFWGLRVKPAMPNDDLSQRWEADE